MILKPPSLCPLSALAMAEIVHETGAVPGWLNAVPCSVETGEKFAKENTLTPFGGMWMATFILLPIGLFLIYKAMRDSQLFNKDAYRRIPRALKIFFNKKSLLKRVPLAPMVGNNIQSSIFNFK